MTTAPLADDAEHLAAELAGLDLLLLREAVRARRAAGHPPDERGLHVSDDELLQLLARPLAAPLWQQVPIDGALAELDDRLAQHRAELDARINATLALGRPLRLEHLVAAHPDAAALPLKPLLLLALAPELDLRYERIIGWLHDDITRRHPSVQLALDLLAPGPARRLAALPGFAADAPLRRLALLHTHAREPGAALLRHELRLAPGLLAWLSGQVSLPPALAHVITVRPPDPNHRATLRLSSALAAAWDRLHAAAARGARIVQNLHGPDGAGRRSFAAALCGALGRPLYLVDGARSEALGDDDFTDLLAVLARAARLERAAIAWTGFDRQRPALARLQSADLLLLISHRPWHASPAPAGLVALAELHVPIAELPIREQLWRDALPELPADLHRVAADSFRFTPAQISAAAISARGLAETQELPAPDLPGVLLACRRHATPKLGALAGAVTTDLRWSDLILPDEQREQLLEISRRLTHRGRVLDDWGFGRTGARGLAALFAGAPGTGKTLAAAIVARECARDLYRIDLSQVVSKYIGETEKHLELLFAEAEATDAALFFDEADAIFGKRGAVRDASDRFANVEVGFLLQRIESFPGLVILATNLRKNIDAAFLRRLQIVVEFPTPDLASRARIWAGVWPPAAPLDPSVDPQLLAERFDLSGGHIRNIALGAAYAAAEQGMAISLHHVLTAARAEYRKLDKLMREHSFTAPT